MTRDAMEAVIRRYYDGCNEADAAKIASCMTADAVHYFPAGASQGTFRGAAAIAAGWQQAVAQLGSVWTIDELAIDEVSGIAAIEWTHFKPKAGVHLRGIELCRFTDDGLISEIRACYACPVPAPDRSFELGDFDYGGRGYPLTPPAVPARKAGAAR